MAALMTAPSSHLFWTAAADSTLLVPTWSSRPHLHSGSMQTSYSSTWPARAASPKHPGGAVATLNSAALSFALGLVALRSAASHARRRRRLMCRAASRSLPLPGGVDARGAGPVEAVAEALKGLPGQMGRALGGLHQDLEQAVQEALEFAERADDGAQPKLFREADVVLVGPSRAGKTTITKLLAQKGLKVANYPLVPGEEPPSELLELDQRKVVKLTTQLEQLQQVRQKRMQRLGRQSSQYAATDAIRKELSWVKTFYIQNFPRSGPTIDTAKMSIADSMTMIAAQLTGAGIDVNTLSDIAQSSSSLS